MNETQKITRPSYLLKLTWPVFVELILQMLVGNIDQFMVGQYSQLAVGAIGNANQILNVLIITFSVISTAAMILISQYLGANQYSVWSGDRCGFAAVQSIDFSADAGTGRIDGRIPDLYQHHWKLLVFAGHSADSVRFFSQPCDDEGIPGRFGSGQSCERRWKYAFDQRNVRPARFGRGGSGDRQQSQPYGRVGDYAPAVL